jgi:hypothetical protein
LAHALTTDLPLAGDIEPLVGREWRSDKPHHRHAGQHVVFSDVCFIPGTVVRQELDFVVGEFGVWRWLDYRT